MAKSIELTYDTALTLLRRAVHEKGPDYVYNTDDGECAYFDPETGDPSCLVGHALAYCGVTMEDVGALNEGMGIDNLIGEDRLIRCDGLTMDLLVETQYNQDKSKPWGEAVDTAWLETLASLPV